MWSYLISWERADRTFFCNFCLHLRWSQKVSLTLGGFAGEHMTKYGGCLPSLSGPLRQHSPTRHHTANKTSARNRLFLLKVLANGVTWIHPKCCRLLSFFLSLYLLALILAGSSKIAVWEIVPNPQCSRILTPSWWRAITQKAGSLRAPDTPGNFYSGFSINKWILSFTLKSISILWSFWNLQGCKNMVDIFSKSPKEIHIVHQSFR